jgi:hypothetical protein
MTNGKPWWYSGDDEPADGADASEEFPDSPDASDVADDADGPGGGSSMDWTALVAGAARMVDWATSTVMAPHAEHVDPAEHPQCVVCRTILLVGDPVGLGTARPDDGPIPSADQAEPSGPEPITWIPIRD